VSCGEGTKQRVRFCSSSTKLEDLQNSELSADDLLGSLLIGCVGDSFETEACSSTCEKKHGDWSDWSPCSLTCGVGEKTRTRKCLQGNSQDCEDESEAEPCHLGSCGAKWAKWSEFGECSESCGTGTKTRTRLCELGVAGEAGCEGSFFELQNCHNKCEANWAEWGAFSACSQTCNGGLRRRSRDCEDGEIGDPGCVPVQSSVDEEVCNVQACQDSCKDDHSNCRTYITFNPNFCLLYPSYTRKHCTKSCPMFCIHPGMWMSWGSCSKSCGGGFQMRRRKCLRPGCSTEQRRSCNNNKCEGFSLWSSWSTCSVTCGPGTTTRSRICINSDGKCPPDEHGTSLLDTTACEETECPGTWQAWTSWSQCSKTCSEGVKTRSRECVGNVPGGPGCLGASDESQPCQDAICQGKWTEWMDMGACSSTCGQGVLTQGRECFGGVIGGPGCVGAATRVQSCKLEECKEEWSTWTEWSQCDKTCGGGVTNRVRMCMNGGSTGQPGCVGEDFQQKKCNTQQCSVVSQELPEACQGLLDLDTPAGKRSRVCLMLTDYCIQESPVWNQFKINCALSCCVKKEGTANCSKQNLLPDATCQIYVQSNLCGMPTLAERCQKSCGCR